jgi:flagellar hook assembly protein FlgD
LSGHFDAKRVPQLAWDGRDQAGDRVPPGLYLVTLTVDGDARQTRRARTVGVAY